MPHPPPRPLTRLTETDATYTDTAGRSHLRLTGLAHSGHEYTVPE